MLPKQSRKYSKYMGQSGVTYVINKQMSVYWHLLKNYHKEHF